MRNLTLTFLTVAATPLLAQNSDFNPSLNLYGTSGLVELPTAQSQPEGEISLTFGKFSDITHTTIAFQILPQLSFAYRQSYIDTPLAGKTNIEDSSYDVHFQILKQGKYIPNVAIGARDFVGNGLHRGQYIVASKTIGAKLNLTAGIGWGQFSHTRSQINKYANGTAATGGWFQGSPSLFGGLEWQTPLKRLRFKAEYSPINYSNSAAFKQSSAFNFALNYRFKFGTEIEAYYLYGSEFGFRFSHYFNLKKNYGLTDNAPKAIMVRDQNITPDAHWVTTHKDNRTIHNALDALLNPDGLFVENINFSQSSAVLSIRNTRYNIVSQAIGRAARAMTHVFPASVEVFKIILVENGLSTSLVTLQRRDLEKYENHPKGAILISNTIDIVDAPPLKATPDSAMLYPGFHWSLAPYIDSSGFQAGKSNAINAGVELALNYDIKRGLFLKTAIRKQLFKRSDNQQRNNATLPAVRRDIDRYYDAGTLTIDELSAHYLFKLAPALYGRLSAGYLESMFAGVSSELLWKPTQEKWALGFELNYVKQRDFKQRFALRDYETTTGHLIFYYQLPNDFKVELSVGRYLAGDTGASLRLSRVFHNGWKIGAFVTTTNQSKNDFNSPHDNDIARLNQGIQIEIPLGVITGKSSRDIHKIKITSHRRDSGARLNSSTRLYDTIVNNDSTSIFASWGRFWR